MPNIRLTHPELSPNAAAAAAKVSPEIRELIKRSGKKPVREYTLGEEIFNAVTHGVGAGLAVAALVLLIVKSVADGGGILLAAALVYGIAQLLEYLMSTLYHALAAERAKRVFKVLDHSGHLPAHRRYLHPLLPHHLGTCGRHLARRLRLGRLTCRHRL